MQERSQSYGGIAWLVGMAFLVGIIGIPVQATGNVGDRIGQGVCAFFTLGACLFFWQPGDPFQI